jgi:hypothetical protein
MPRKGDDVTALDETIDGQPAPNATVADLAALAGDLAHPAGDELDTERSARIKANVLAHVRASGRTRADLDMHVYEETNPATGRVRIANVEPVDPDDRTRIAETVESLEPRTRAEGEPS